MLGHHRSIAWLAGTLGLAAVLAFALAPKGGSAPTAGPPIQVIQQHHDSGQASGFANLTADQKLDRSTTLPGIQGVLRGRIGGLAVHEVPDPTGPKGRAVVTDYILSVEDFYGPARAPYSKGSIITLRVPGGTLNGQTLFVEDAPKVLTHSEVFVFVRDQGSIVGGNTARVLVASSTADVFEVSSASVVGQGPFAGFSEPLAKFIGHFTRP